METAYIIRNGVIIGSGTNSSLNPDSSSTYIINCTVISETGLEIEVANYDGDFTKIKQTIADGGKVELRTNFNSSNYILEPSRIEENYVTFNTIDKNANITIKVTEYGINDVSYIDLNSSGGGGAAIDDTTTNTDTVWSSKKTSDEITKVDASLGELEKNVKFDADDLNTAYVPNKTITVRTNKNTKNLPPSSMVNFLVTSFAYIEGQHYRITQYCYENSENLSYEMYVRRGTSNAGESSITWSAWTELATMDKVALKHEQFDKKVTLTDSNWKYKKLTFTKSYMNTPSVNVSCGDYINPEFYSYWGCEAYIININNEGCTIRYRSSKASESEPLEVNIIVFVNGI